MLDTTTGEVVSMTLKHEGNNVREFYSKLPRPVRVGIEATGSMQWFVNLMEELGIECLVGHPAQIRAAEPRKQKHDRRDADLILKLLGKSLSGDLAAFERATGSAVFVAAPSSVGKDADANTKCAEVDSLGEWSTARYCPVEPRRTKHDRIAAVDAPYRISAE
jgi:transposase